MGCSVPAKGRLTCADVSALRLGAHVEPRGIKIVPLTIFAILCHVPVDDERAVGQALVESRHGVAHAVVGRPGTVPDVAVLTPPPELRVGDNDNLGSVWRRGQQRVRA
jgi:hypothetical protein